MSLLIDDGLRRRLVGVNSLPLPESERIFGMGCTRPICSVDCGILVCVKCIGERRRTLGKAWADHFTLSQYAFAQPSRRQSACAMRTGGIYGR